MEIRCSYGSALTSIPTKSGPFLTVLLARNQHDTSEQYVDTPVEYPRPRTLHLLNKIESHVVVDMLSASIFLIKVVTLSSAVYVQYVVLGYQNTHLVVSSQGNTVRNRGSTPSKGILACIQVPIHTRSIPPCG
jgi:hypothetical protein